MVRCYYCLAPTLFIVYTSVLHDTDSNNTTMSSNYASMKIIFQLLSW